MAELSEKEALQLFIEKIRGASDAARVLAHASKREGFLRISELLRDVEIKSINFAVKGTYQ